MKNDEIQTELKRLHNLEIGFLAQIKTIRQAKKKLVKNWYEQNVNHEDETPLEREVKATKK